jgi:polyhydroxyalkanoate synthesis regulator phasin
MATSKKAAPAKKAAPRKTRTEKAATPVKDSLVQHHAIPLSEAPQFIQDLFRPGISDMSNKGKVERILSILDGTDEVELNNILEDVNIAVDRRREDESKALRRSMRELQLKIHELERIASSL